MDTNGNTKELIKDLCSRLPYGVKCYGYCFKIDGNHCECYGTLDSIKLGVWYPFHLSNRMSINNGATYEETFSEVKPYLFPLSSMTEEQKDVIDLIASNSNTPLSDVVDFYNKNHFDYRGLIEKDLAIDATGLNIY
jgi:hypothetical protein